MKKHIDIRVCSLEVGRLTLVANSVPGNLRFFFILTLEFGEINYFISGKVSENNQGKRSQVESFQSQPIIILYKAHLNSCLKFQVVYFKEDRERHLTVS